MGSASLIGNVKGDLVQVAEVFLLDGVAETRSSVCSSFRGFTPLTGEEACDFNVLEPYIKVMLGTTFDVARGSKSRARLEGPPEGA